MGEVSVERWQSNNRNTQKIKSEKIVLRRLRLRERERERERLRETERERERERERESTIQ